ncbi:MAG: hypothetical protein F4Z10_01550 [Synechococcus sp. SB0666_bin_14]|nr:hypothetical protein [Synechococcus sp. SB0666_bin_14]
MVLTFGKNVVDDGALREGQMWEEGMGQQRASRKMGAIFTHECSATTGNSVALGQKPRKPIEHQRKSLTGFLEVLLAAKLQT